MSESEEEICGPREWHVTADWLETILVAHHRDGGGDDDAAEKDVSVAVSNFAVSPGCDAGDSVLSDILAVELDYVATPGTSAKRSLSLIIKLLPRDPFSRFFVTEAQFDLREIRFYTQVHLTRIRSSISLHPPPLASPIERGTIVLLNTFVSYLLLLTGINLKCTNNNTTFVVG